MGINKAEQNTLILSERNKELDLVVGEETDAFVDVIRTMNQNVTLQLLVTCTFDTEKAIVVNSSSEQPILKLWLKVRSNSDEPFFKIKLFQLIYITRDHKVV